jgi:hypothetical protein
MTITRTWRSAAFALISLQAVAADPLPRVFFTEHERAQIVQLRSKVARAEPGAAAPSSDTASVAATDEVKAPGMVQAAPPVLRLEGVSIASSGAMFAWIGGQRYANGARLAGQRLEISAQGVVMVDAAGRSRRIRVGEALPSAKHTAGTKP